MKKIIACFVLENGTYVEVPVDAVIENGKFKEEYAGRFFYPFNQYLLEMSKEDRRYFYLCREVMKEMVHSGHAQSGCEFRQYIMVPLLPPSPYWWTVIVVLFCGFDHIMRQLSRYADASSQYDHLGQESARQHRSQCPKHMPCHFNSVLEALNLTLLSYHTAYFSSIEVDGETNPI